MSLVKIAATAVCAAFLLALHGCGKEDQGHAKEKEKAAEEHKDEGVVKLSDTEAARVGLKTESLVEQDLVDTLHVSATVEANRERIAHVTGRFPGRITKIAAKLGDPVKQGQSLAVIESIEAGEASSAYAQALAEAAVARTAFERAERLHAEQIIAGKEFQRARGEYDKTRAQVRAASDKLKMLGINPGSAQGGSLSSFPVQAPLAGTVIERKAVLGELAKAEESLFVIADLSKVWLEANISEADLGRVRIGAKTRARVAGYPDEVFEGTVGHVRSVLDKETRTAKAIIELDNAKGMLRPQMFASVIIETGRGRKALMLPESAITLVQGLPTVFVEEAAGFAPRPVELAERAEGKAVVKSGVQAGDLVVVEGVYALKARLLKSQIGEGHAH